MKRITYAVILLLFLFLLVPGSVSAQTPTPTRTPTPSYRTPTWNASTYTPTMTPVITSSLIDGCPATLGEPSEYTLQYLKECNNCFPQATRPTSLIPTYNIQYYTKTPVITGTPATPTPTRTATTQATQEPTTFFVENPAGDSFQFPITWTIQYGFPAATCTNGATLVGLTFLAEGSAGGAWNTGLGDSTEYSPDYNTNPGGSEGYVWYAYPNADYRSLIEDELGYYPVHQHYYYNHGAYGTWKGWGSEPYVTIKHFNTICLGQGPTPTPTPELCNEEYNPTKLNSTTGFVSAASALNAEDMRFWYDHVIGNIQARADFSIKMREVSKIAFKVPPGELYEDGPFAGSFTARVIGCNNELIAQYDQLEQHITGWAGWDFASDKKCVDKVIIDYNPTGPGEYIWTAVSHVEITGCPIEDANVCLSPSEHYQQPGVAGFGWSGITITPGACLVLIPDWDHPFNSVADWIPDDWGGFWDTLDDTLKEFTLQGVEVCPSFVSMPQVRIFNYDIPIASMVAFTILYMLFKDMQGLFS